MSREFRFDSAVELVEMSSVDCASDPWLRRVG